MVEDWGGEWDEEGLDLRKGYAIWRRMFKKKDGIWIFEFDMGRIWIEDEGILDWMMEYLGGNEPKFDGYPDFLGLMTISLVMWVWNPFTLCIF
jgi:hypothetical protein